MPDGKDSERITYMETKEEEWLRFIDTLSHELRTPLTSIIAAAGLLAEELEISGDKSSQKLIQTIIQNSNTLETRLAELMDIVKTGSGKLQLQSEPVDFKSLVRGTCMQISPLLQGKGQKLEIDVPSSLPIIHGDGQRLEQVVLNLLNNAVKFNDSRVKQIEIGWKHARNGYYEFYIKDNGIGISPRDHQRIFDIFGRLHHREKYGGNGIGLAIVKKGCSRLGGSVSVESRRGQGSTFYLTIADN